MLTLSPPNKLSSAKLLVCFNFQSALMSLNENVDRVLNGLDPDETPSVKTAWILMRRLVTQHLIRIQAVCIWHFSQDLRPKG